jgi:vacuole morphology and inheritance protein 14
VEPKMNPFLYKCLYSLLLLLPQSHSFDTLQNRIDSVVAFAVMDVTPDNLYVSNVRLY